MTEAVHESGHALAAHALGLVVFATWAGHHAGYTHVDVPGTRGCFAPATPQTAVDALAMALMAVSGKAAEHVLEGTPLRFKTVSGRDELIAHGHIAHPALAAIAPAEVWIQQLLRLAADLFSDPMATRHLRHVAALLRRLGSLRGPEIRDALNPSRGGIQAGAWLPHVEELCHT